MQALAVAPSGEVFASGSADGTVCVWSLACGTWLQRFVALRKEHPVFGLGAYEALETSNSRIFAHVRQHDRDTVLCVHNLARSAQAVELDLARFQGRTPIEMTGRTPFPSIGDLPYLLTFGPRGFFWFLLPEEEPDA